MMYTSGPKSDRISGCLARISLRRVACGSVSADQWKSAFATGEV
jgi:hypothetical protein